MKLAVVIATSLALVSCDQRQPRMTEAQLQKIKAYEPGMTDECLDKARWGGIEAMPTDQCFRMEPQRRWRGLWTTGLESSRFCPAPATDCSGGAGGEYIWLSASPSMHLPDYEGQSPEPVYAVDFIGRKTATAGHYGHFGMSDQEVMVDRLISIRQIGGGPVPSPPTEAEIKASQKSCETDPQCLAPTEMEAPRRSKN